LTCFAIKMSNYYAIPKLRCSDRCRINCMKLWRFSMKSRLPRFALFTSLIIYSAANAAFAAPATQCSQNAQFNVGAGIYDITGPAAEEGMMGYGIIRQQTAGI